MGKFQEDAKPKLTYEEIENLSRTISSKDFELVILKLKEIPRSRWLHCSFKETFREIIPTIHKLFQKIEERGIFFYDARITLIPKSKT